MNVSRWFNLALVTASVLGLVAYLFARTAVGQANTLDISHPPCGITLLSGYHYTRLSSDDSYMGTLSKPGE